MNKIMQLILWFIFITTIIGIGFLILQKISNINSIRDYLISPSSESTGTEYNTETTCNQTLNYKENTTLQNIKKENIEAFWYNPKPGISWQLQLQGDINTKYDVDLYDIDLFDSPQYVIDELHNRDIKVICYFSAGSAENWRDDFDKFPKSVLGKDYKNWPGEKWLDISNYEMFKDIMLARLDLAVKKKCDGVDPDNIQGYKEDTGFNLNYEDQLRYNIWLANETHKRNLSIALKNDGEQVKNLIDYYDFAVVESCFEFNECEPYKEFIKQNKAVLGVEYNLKIDEFCSEANDLNFSWLKMDYELDGNRISCNTN